MTSLNLSKDSARSGSCVGRIGFIHLADFVRFQSEVVGQETLYVQFVSLVKIGCVLIVGVLGNIVFIGQKWANSSELQYALAAVHDSQFILAHKLLAQFLIVEGMGNLPPPALSRVEGIDCFFSQCGGQLLQGGRLFAAQKNGGVHVADDGVGIVLVDCLELGLCLQHQTAGNLTGADGCHQLFKPWNLSDVRRLVNQAADMDGKPAAVNIVGFLAEEVEKLGVAQRNEEIEGIVGIRHDDEKGRLAISQGVQFQLVIGGQVTQLLNIKGSQPCAAGN